MTPTGRDLSPTSSEGGESFGRGYPLTPFTFRGGGGDPRLGERPLSPIVFGVPVKGFRLQVSASPTVRGDPFPAPKERRTLLRAIHDWFLSLPPGYSRSVHPPSLRSFGVTPSQYRSICRTHGAAQGDLGPRRVVHLTRVYE